MLLPVSFRNWSLKTLAFARASLMGMKKMPKAFGLHFWIGLAHNSSTQVET